MANCIVIGSGPSGVSAAVALLGKDHRVVMLDAGLQLEAERARAVEDLIAAPPGTWDSVRLAPLKEGVEVTSSGIPLKHLYGSDYPFRGTDAFYDIEKRGVDVAPSFALGGLSTVWGSGILPFCDADMEGWPISAADLDEHYRSVFSFMPCAAVRDDLERQFPLHVNQFADLRPSRQAELFFRDTDRGRENLRRSGITVGRSRLAVYANGDNRWRKPPCVYCGLCLYGCPYGLIYNSAYTIAALSEHPDFTYRPDVIVERIEERAGQAIVHGRERTSRSDVRVTGDRVFLGAGVLPTTAILLRSLDIFDKPVEILDSMYFLLPLLRFRGVARVWDEPLHTLAQAFIIIQDDAICREHIGISVYTYNDLLVPALRESAGPIGRNLGRLWRELGTRTLILGGYLHSRHSPRIRMTLRREGADSRTAIRLEGDEDPASKQMARKVAAKLLRHAKDFQALPLIPFLRFSPPGRGFHCGGSFPMKRCPQPGTSDPLGRPHGFSMVHIIDASSFPSIPATTITLPIMANAHRIASEALES